MVVVENTDNSSLSAEGNNFSPEKPTSGEIATAERHMGVRKGVFSYMSKKPVLTMLVEAVKVLGSEGNGASMPAITKWICANYAVSDVEKLKLNLRKAVMKALKAGVLQRSNSSKKSLGTAGSFILPNKAKKRASVGRRKSNGTAKLDANGSE